MKKLEKVIETLSMAVTHSEQGFYAKNEEFVRKEVMKAYNLGKKDAIEAISKNEGWEETETFYKAKLLNKNFDWFEDKKLMKKVADEANKEQKELMKS